MKKRKQAAPWNRPLWGVVFIAKGEPILISTGWNKTIAETGEPYPGEPMRVLLFCTRRQAQAWCKQKMARYAGRVDQSCADWRFRPVRVREIVRVVA